jgi:hypothetical protein
MESTNYAAHLNGSANTQLANGQTAGGQVARPPLLSDEKIFEWEYRETQGPPDQGDEGYRYYKNLKSRYIFEVTNWFQPPLNN